MFRWGDQEGTEGTVADFGPAARILRERDEVLREIIDKVGPCTLRLESNAFRALAESIIYQQLATRAADTIAARFIGIYQGRDFPCPEDVLNTSDDTLRQAGLSKQKTRYLKALAEKLVNGSLDPSCFPDLTDEEIIAQLTEVPGIGRWTAEMYLIFSLGRSDILPLADLGVQNAVQRHYEQGEPITKAQLRQLGERWRPYRTMATLYLWKSVRLGL